MSEGALVLLGIGQTALWIAVIVAVLRYSELRSRVIVLEQRPTIALDQSDVIRKIQSRLDAVERRALWSGDRPVFQETFPALTEAGTIEFLRCDELDNIDDVNHLAYERLCVKNADLRAWHVARSQRPAAVG